MTSDDEEAGVDKDNELVWVNSEVKKERTQVKKAKGVKMEGESYHGPKRGGFGDDEPGEGGGSGGQGPGSSSAQPIELF